MNGIEDSLFAARQAEIQSNTPGRLALADAEAEQARVRRTESDAEADAQWRSNPNQLPNYDYREAHAQGVDLAKGELPNKFHQPGAVNIGGYDLATGDKIKPVVDRRYEENAYYGAEQLKRSRILPGKGGGFAPKPAQDIMGLAAFAASLQGSGKTYDDFARMFPAWDDTQLERSWRAGTDSLRLTDIIKQDGWGPVVSIYPPAPTSLDFDVRMADKEFQQTGRRLYKHFHGTALAGTDLDAAYWLANHMRNLDFSSPMMAAIMLKAKNATWDVHQDYVRAIEAWNLTNMEKRVLPQLGNFARLLFDPLNLAGAGIGKMTVVTAGRAAALDFFKRMLVGGAGGAAGGVIQSTVSASAQGRGATGEEQVAAGAIGTAAGGVLSGVVPEAFALAGMGIKRAAKAFERPGLPALVPNNVAPRTASGEYIPADSGIYGEISLPNRPGDQPVRTTPLLLPPVEQEPYPGAAGLPQTMEELQALPSERDLTQAWRTFARAEQETQGSLNDFELVAVRSDVNAGGLTPESREALERSPHGQALIRAVFPGDEPPEGHGMGPAMDPTLDDDRALVQIGETQAFLGLSNDEIVNAEWNAGIREPLETMQQLQLLLRAEEIQNSTGMPGADAYERAAVEFVAQQVGNPGEPHGQAWGRLDIWEPVQPAGPPMPDLPPVVNRPALPQDPTSRIFIDPDTGYYSPVQRHIAQHAMDAQTGKEWFGSVISTDRKGARTGKPDVREDEVAAMGLEEFLLHPKNAGRKMPKQEVLDFINQHLVKIQRYPLIPQVRQTKPLSVHLSETNPEYARIEQEFEAVEHEALELRATMDAAAVEAQARRDLARRMPDFGDVAELASANDPHSARLADLWERSRALQKQLAAIADEERKLMQQTGNVPPGLHGMEHLLSDPDSDSHTFRSLLNELLVFMDSAATHRDLLAKARRPGTRAQYQEDLNNDEATLQELWKAMNGHAANAGAVIMPADLDRVLPHFKFKYQDLRYSALLGKDEPGGRIRNGVDPLGHQVHVYIHPEGLKLPGAAIHPGGEATGILGWAYSSIRQLASGEWMHFIDEGQSDHVKARYKAEKRFNEIKAGMQGQAIQPGTPAAEVAAAADYDDWVWKRYRHDKNVAASERRGSIAASAQKRAAAMPLSWAETTPADRIAMARDPIWAESSTRASGMDYRLEAIPFQIFAPTAQFNIFKSELFNAAREGKDWFGWTTTEVAQSRYPNEAAKHVENPEFYVGGNQGDQVHVTSHDEHGRRNTTYKLTFQEAYEFADKLAIGSVEARKFVEAAERAYQTRNELHAGVPPGAIYLHTEKPVMIKEGSYWDYNRKVKSQMDNFLKRYGVKVELVEMPIAPGSPTTVKVWGVRLNQGLGRKLLEGVPEKKLPPGVPIGAAAAAAAGLAAQEPQQEMQ